MVAEAWSRTKYTVQLMRLVSRSCSIPASNFAGVTDEANLPMTVSGYIIGYSISVIADTFWRNR